MTRKSLLTVPFALLVFAGGYWSGMSQTKTRVFELRTYTTNEGKLPDLQKRFRDHTVEIFTRLGMTSVGYFTPQDKPNTLVYVLAFPSRDAATKSWNAFKDDAEWKKVSAASEENGKIVSHVDSVFMDPTDYSPMK
jgi:predicted GIY-YIG superfamily endonuclease